MHSHSMAYEGSNCPLAKDGGNNHLLDRSKVKILLCDNNAKGSQEVLGLLRKCSYQVTSVRTARQVIDALNAEGSEIDLILAEVDLPISKGLKMLKYIARNKELHRIPIIRCGRYFRTEGVHTNNLNYLALIVGKHLTFNDSCTNRKVMSSRDEVLVVVKCLRLGAADYLVKPLRTNELLNLWTHMWRRRHMLGLAEKNILNYDFDLAASDPSDANTNSTTFFSDDTDDKSRKNVLPEISVSNHTEHGNSAVEISLMNASGHHLNMLDDQPGNISSFPKKSLLKVGENSAFFSYVKSNVPLSSNSSKLASIDEKSGPSQGLNRDERESVSEQVGDGKKHRGQDAYEYNCTSRKILFNGENGAEDDTSTTLSSVPKPTDYLHGWKLSKEQFTSPMQLHPFSPNFPFYFPQFMHQAMMPSTAAQYYQATLDGVAKHASSVQLPHYGGSILPHGSHAPINMMGSCAYYHPAHVNGQPGQVPTIPQLWPPAVANTSSSDVKSVQVERREAALMKFRQKRKDRCFDKKIRYLNRKQLAERRPRVRGQFVRQTNGASVDLNGRPVADDYTEDDEDDEDEEDYASEY